MAQAFDSGAFDSGAFEASAGGGANQTLLPPLLTSGSAVFAPATTTSPVALTPALLTNTSTVFAPVVTKGAVTLTAPLLTSGSAIFSPAVTSGAATLTSPLLTNSQTFFAPALTVGSVTLTQQTFNAKNLIPNSTMAGATSSSFPSSWTTYSSSGSSGVTVSVVGTGTDGFGVPYLDVRFNGTATSLTYPEVLLNSPEANGPLASVGQSLTFASDIQVVAGSLVGGLLLSIRELTSAGGYLGNQSGAVTPSGVDGRYSVTRTLSQPKVGRTGIYILKTVNTSETVDFTLRIRRPQLEYGSASTEYIPTSGTPVEASTVNQFFSPSVASSAPTLAPSLLSNANSVFAPSVATGAVTLAPALLTNSQSFPAPTVTASKTLTPVQLPSVNAFFAPAVTASAPILLPPLVASGGALLAPVVSRGAVSVSPPLLTNTSTTFVPAVTRGAVTVAPPAIANAQTMFAPVVTRGSVNVGAPLLGSSNALFAPTVTRGSVSVAPPLLASTNVFFNPVVARDLGIDINALVEAIWRHNKALTMSRYVSGGANYQMGTYTPDPALQAVAEAVWADPRAMTNQRHLILKE